MDALLVAVLTQGVVAPERVDFHLSRVRQLSGTAERLAFRYLLSISESAHARLARRVVGTSMTKTCPHTEEGPGTSRLTVKAEII